MEKSNKFCLHLKKNKRVKSRNDFFQKTRNLLTHASSDIRAEALHNLYYYKNHDISDEVEMLTKDPSQQVKITAFEYLMKRSPENNNALINRFLADEDEEIRGAALVSIAKETRDNLTLKKKYEIENKIQVRLDALATNQDPKSKKHRTLNLIKAIGYANIPIFYPRLTTYLHSGDFEVLNHAIIAAGKTLSPVFIDDLIRLLAVRECKENAMNALVHFDKNIVDFLKTNVDEGEVDPESPKSDSFCSEKKIGAQRSIDFLFELFDYEDHVVRLEALRGLNFLRNNYPHLKFSKRNIVHEILKEAKLFKDTLSIFICSKLLLKKVKLLWRQEMEKAEKTMHEQV